MLAGPFGCQCPSSAPCPVSTPRSSNRTCGFAASEERTGHSRYRECPRLAFRELAHPYSQAFALVIGAWFHYLRREEQAIRELAEANLALCREQEFAHLYSWGTMWQGWSLVVQGQLEEGIAQLRQCLAAFRQQNIQIFAAECS